MSRKDRHLAIDAAIVGMSIAFAVYIAEFGLAERFISLFDSEIIAAFLSGMLFTSFFTTAPAIVLLGKLSESVDTVLLVAVGGFAAMLGDMLLFWFVKDRIADDLRYLVAPAQAKKIHRAFHSKLLRHLTPFLGLLIIASPLPDEMGIALLGLYKIKTKRFLLASFIANAFGILIIALVARSFI